jgi:hypothetical protein
MEARMSAPSSLVHESVSAEIAAAAPEHIGSRSRDRGRRVVATPRVGARPGRGLGRTLLRIFLLAVLGPPALVAATLAATLALVMAGSIVVVAAMLFGFALVAALAIGVAG